MASFEGVAAAGFAAFAFEAAAVFEAFVIFSDVLLAGDPQAAEIAAKVATIRSDLNLFINILL
jgi:hypothetical protein